MDHQEQSGGYELILTPSGHLRITDTVGPDGTPIETWTKRVAAAFTRSTPEGVFALAASKPAVPPPPVFSFWRSVVVMYMTRLCRTPEAAEVRVYRIEPPTESELVEMTLSAPPMQGGEYLSPDVIRNLWMELDAWVHGEIDASPDGLSGWLRRNAGVWHQVGRVCFHLAENKRDPEFPFAFLATYAPRLSKSGQVQYQPLGKALAEYAGERNRQELVNLLSPVHRASGQVDFVRELIESGDIYHPLAWAPGEAYRLLESVPVLEENGILVRLPDWWRRRPRPRVSVTIGDKNRGLFGADAMLDFRVAVALGDEELSESEWKEILSSGQGLVNVRGQWIEVDREKLSEALAHWKKVETEAAGEGISFIEGMRLLAGAPTDLSAKESAEDGEREWSFVGAGDWLSGILAGLRNLDGLPPAGTGGSFRGTLRPYQETGRNWLRFLTGIGLGACLADDMGLGKTIQIISLLAALKETAPDDRPSILVLPASLLSNWKAELTRFAPALTVAFIHPSEANGFPAAGDLENVDVVLTTYGMLLRQTWLLDTEWRLAILDEAQAIKNPSSRQTRAVKRLKAGARIALTGTPVENRLSDLWSLFDFLIPGLLGSAEKFKRFVKALEAREHDRYAPLRNLVHPYILRRLKTDRTVIADLPDKTEMKAYCGLTRAQTALYASSVAELSTALHELDGMRRRGLVLAFLMRLKQICNHPSQLLGDGGYEWGDSGKFTRLGEICEEIAARQEKVLVFTQFREMTAPIASYLAEVFGREGLVLHGGTEVKKRKNLVDRFQEEDGEPFFVLSLKAGGTGLNLTAASHVIHFDRWWNPAVENQATDRAFRIGQHRNVVVHKFVCRGTIEEKIDALIEEKTALAGDILDNGAETMLTEMSDEKLLEIVSLDLERAMM